MASITPNAELLHNAAGIEDRTAPAVELDALIRRLSPTCPGIEGMTEGVLRDRHAMMFERIAENTEQFLCLMREHGAVVGGSAVLQIVCPMIQDVTDYDLFVPARSATAFIAHLTTVEGYELHTRDDIDVHPAENGCMVNNTKYWSGVSSHVKLRKGECTVDVLGVGVGDDWDRVLLPIARAWATILINYASADELCITYPSLTLQGKALARVEHVLDASFPGVSEMEELEKYQGRGIEFRSYADDWDDYDDGMPRYCADSWVCPVRRRAFGDDGCLVVRRGAGGAQLGGVSWTLGGGACPFICGSGVNAVTAVHTDWCICPKMS